MLDALAKFAMFEDADTTMRKFVSTELLLKMQQPEISLFLLKRKRSLVGLLLVVFWPIFVNSTDFRIPLVVELTSFDCSPP